jgi:signal peptidase I
MGSVRPMLFKLLAYTVAATFVGLFFLNSTETEKELMPHGHSMLPSIESGKVILATRSFENVFRGDIFVINQNKTEMPTERTPDGPYIKRVLGMPGDILTLSKDDGSLEAVNGELVSYEANESYPRFSFNSTQDSMPNQSIPVSAYTVSVGSLSYPAYLADKKIFASTSRLSDFAEMVFNYPWLEQQDASGGHYYVEIPDAHYFVASDNFIGEDSRHFGLVHRSAFIYKFKG